MKTVLRIAATLLISASVLAAASLAIDVDNWSDNERKGEVVAIAWKSLLEKNDKLTAENARVVDAAGKTLLSQAVDNDGDTSIDELLFISDDDAGGEKGFEVRADDSLKMPDSEIRAFARYVPERKDDFAWENDVVAFRVYGPGLRDGVENCGVDCFMKRVKYPIIDRWYKRVSYHLDNGEGHDAYKVGSGLGCGGTAVWIDGKMSKPDVYSTWKQFANGPIRVVFELTYGPWDVGGRQIVEKKRISLDLGSRMFKVDELYLADGKPAKLDIAVGLSTHDGDAAAYENTKRGWVYTWEKIDDFHLGTAVLMASPGAIKEYKLYDPGKKYEDHAMFVATTGDDGRLQFYAGYGWEKAAEIVTRGQWEAYIEAFKNKIDSPVEAKIK